MKCTRVLHWLGLHQRIALEGGRISNSSVGNFKVIGDNLEVSGQEGYGRWSIFSKSQPLKLMLSMQAWLCTTLIECVKSRMKTFYILDWLLYLVLFTTCFGIGFDLV